MASKKQKIDTKANNKAANKQKGPSKQEAKEDLKKLKEKEQEDIESSSEEPEEEESSSEDEDEEANLAKYVADDFMRVVPLIRAKHPDIYDKEKRFFRPEPVAEVVSEEENSHGKKEKKVTYKDAIRQQILEKAAKGEDASSESDDEEHSKSNSIKQEKKKVLSLADEQRLAKEEFLRAFAAAEAGEQVEEENLLQKRAKTQEEIEKEENEYKAFLKKLEQKKVNEERDKHEVEILTGFWENDNLADDDKFLREYITNKRWLDKEAAKIPSYDELVKIHHDDVDAEAYEKQEEFEHKYNFRYEEPGGAQIMTYARDIDSVRKKDTSRADARKKRDERKAKEAKQIEDEKKREIKKKKREIVDRLLEIQKAAGIEADETLKNMDLDGDFDPDQWDKKMQSIFNDEYYNADDNEKPVFDSDDEGGYEDMYQGSDIATASSFLAKNKEENFEQDAEQDQEMNEGEQEGDEEMNQDEENGEENNEEYNDDEAEENPEGNIIYDESGNGRKSKRKLKKERKNLKNLSLKDYFDEIYKLDYEDVIADGLKTRFKYTTVPAANYGMSVVDILEKDEKDLNQIVPIKKLQPYREDKGLVKGFNRRRGGPVSNQRGPAPAKFGAKNNGGPNNRGPNNRGPGNATNKSYDNNKASGGSSKVIRSNKFDKTLNNYVAQNFKQKNTNNNNRNNNKGNNSNNKSNNNNNRNNNNKGPKDRNNNNKSVDANKQ
jgi:protein KRI1